MSQVRNTSSSESSWADPMCSMSRLMHRLGRIPPAQAEAGYYATINPATPAAHKN